MNLCYFFTTIAVELIFSKEKIQNYSDGVVIRVVCATLGRLDEFRHEPILKTVICGIIKVKPNFDYSKEYYDAYLIHVISETIF